MAAGTVAFTAGRVMQKAYSAPMSASVSWVNAQYGNAGKRCDPSRRTPSRIARVNASSDQSPIPVSGSGVMFVP